ncbi:unnamed protein product [Rotaria sordida]|uniref:VCBS repeat-containing protein n=1 Tax=Rotaria sordida TaxID=392033 RepID=A0A819D249_9BILA|nr:unnamed protein product [Rotaria sordida]
MLGYDEFFPIQTTYSTGYEPYSVAVGDFDNDTQLDIVVANRGPAIHDFNKDGQADITVANHGTKNLVTFLGRGNGTFENQASYGVSFNFDPLVVGAGNFDKDERSEIVVAYEDMDNVDVFVTYDTGSFGHQITYITGYWSNFLAVGDFNNDTRLDLVVAHGQNDITYPTGSGPSSVVVGDFNHDTRLDIVVTNFYGKSIIRRQKKVRWS